MVAERKPVVNSYGGLGDPITVDRRRPSPQGIHKWAAELAADPDKRRFLHNIVARLDPADLATIGYPLETFWEPVDALGTSPQLRPPPVTAYRLQRWLITRGRRLVRLSPRIRAKLELLRLACNVLLRHY